MNKKKLIGIIAASALVIALVAVLCVSCAGQRNGTLSAEPSVPATEPQETEQQREPGVYFINIIASANGTVTADRTEARQGDQVTLTATPDEG